MIIKISLDKTIEYVINYCVAVVWLSATNLSFIVNYPSILMSKFKCTLTCSQPGLIYPFLISLDVKPSCLSNDIQTFGVSFAIYLVQKLVPYCLRISYASFTVLGNHIPKIYDVREYLDFILEIILSQRKKVSLTHQLKTGSSLISFVTAFYAS